MPRTLVLGLGNDLLADDGVGVAVASRLVGVREDGVEIVTSAAHGLELLDLFLGYDRAIVIDAIQTTEHPPGTVLELGVEDLRPVIAPSPHYAGLPELCRLADALRLDFPSEVRILAVVAADLHTVGAGMTAAVEDCIPALCDRVRRMLGARE